MNLKMKLNPGAKEHNGLAEDAYFSRVDWHDPATRGLIEAAPFQVGGGLVSVDRYLEQTDTRFVLDRLESIYPANLVTSFQAAMETLLKPQWPEIHRQKVATGTNLARSEELSKNAIWPHFEDCLGGIYENSEWSDLRFDEFGAKACDMLMSVKNAATMKFNEVEKASDREKRQHRGEFADFINFFKELSELINGCKATDLETMKVGESQLPKIERLLLQAYTYKVRAFTAIRQMMPGFAAAYRNRGYNPVQDDLSNAFFGNVYSFLYNLHMFVNRDARNLKAHDFSAVTDVVSVHLSAPLRLAEIERRILDLRKSLVN